MSEPPAAKRRRAGGESPVLGFDATDVLSILPPDSQRALLLKAARDHHDVASAILAEKERIIAAELSKQVDFDYNSKTAWKALNVTYKHLSGSHQFDAAPAAYSVVEGCIEGIRDKCPPYSSFQTKKNALETLRKIGKTICLSNTGVVGHEVRKSFQMRSMLEETMLGIAQSMSQVERDRVMQTDGWSNKLYELMKLARECCVFEGLRDVVLTMADEESEEDESEEEDEDDDEDEGNEEGEDEIEGMESDDTRGLEEVEDEEDDDDDEVEEVDARGEPIRNDFRSHQNLQSQPSHLAKNSSNSGWNSSGIPAPRLNAT